MAMEETKRGINTGIDRKMLFIRFTFSVEMNLFATLGSGEKTLNHCHFYIRFYTSDLGLRSKMTEVYLIPGNEISKVTPVWRAEAFTIWCSHVIRNG
jgi:hypothetical protein